MTKTHHHTDGSPSLFILAAETSADQYGQLLLEQLKALCPRLTIVGVGGPLMSKVGLKSIVSYQSLNVMGLSDVIKALPRISSAFFTLKKWILANHPQGVVLIDYPGFNLRLAKSLRKGGYQGKIIQVIAPTVWAHGKERIKTLEDNYDLLISILPFEKKFFPNSSLRVEYIGHPLLELIEQSTSTSDATFVVKGNGPLLALFPGSRLGEIRANLPIQLQAALQLTACYPSLQVAICTTSAAIEKLVQSYLKKFSLSRSFVTVPSHQRYQLMKKASVALAKSGTIALELALHQVPTVVMYKLSLFNRLFAKYILKLKLPYYCLVNILANRKVFPEFIERKFQSTDITQEIISFLENKTVIEACKHDCQLIRQSLITHLKPSQSAAQAILDIL